MSEIIVKMIKTVQIDLDWFAERYGLNSPYTKLDYDTIVEAVEDYAEDEGEKHEDMHYFYGYVQKMQMVRQLCEEYNIKFEGDEDI